MPNSRRRARRWSRVELPFVPAGAVTYEQSPLVKPVRAVAPKLHPFGDDSIAAPVRRARNVLAFEALLHLVQPLFEWLTAVERSRLVGSPGAELRIPGPRREIGIGLCIGDTLDAALDANLAAERLPVK